MPLPINAQYVGVSSTQAHVERAVNFVQTVTPWVQFGRSTPWADLLDGSINDTNPPIADPTKVLADMEPIFYRKSVAQLVVPDAAGSIEVYGRRWRGVAVPNAQAEGARFVHIPADVRFTEGPIGAGDSYLSQNESVGAVVLHVANAAGYVVGDTVAIGVAPEDQVATVAAVNVGANTVTLDAGLLFAQYRWTYLCNVSRLPRLKYRQNAVVGNPTVDLAAPGQYLVPAAAVTGGYLEYHHNFGPVERALNKVTGHGLVLVF